MSQMKAWQLSPKKCFLTVSPLSTDHSSGAIGSTNTFLLLFPGGFNLLAAAVHGLLVP